MSIRHPVREHVVLRAALLALVAFVAGCSDGVPLDPTARPGDALESSAASAPEHAAATVARDLAQLRRATARFHDASVGVQEGYDVLVTHPETHDACLEHPTLGGMGRHLLDLSLADGEVSVTEPEVLIYEPQHNGRLRLVGVEYLVPFDVLGPTEPAPVLFGREFVQNETFGVWALHVWAWKHNPSGIFADWNPTVNCDFDAAVGS